MQIAVDQNITGVAETFAHHGEVLPVDGRNLRREQLRHTKALIVRSVTKVDSGLLEHTPVEFVGSTTIGTDHLDTNWLEQNGITWASAPGCNANSAAQYTMAMMLLASRRIGFELSKSKIGIVGYGNVGSRLCHLIQALGLPGPVLNDPPLAKTGHPGLSGLDQIMQCDVISFHVPLSTTGADATFGMVDAKFLSRLPPYTLLVNTARGKLIKAGALLDWLRSGRGFAALDVFPEEPYVGGELLEACTVATPHVAGYSLDGKLAGTLMVYERFCQWLKVTPPPEPQLFMSALEMHGPPPGHYATPAELILACCPVERDDRNLRESAGLEPTGRATHFDALRRDYPARRDFSGWIRPPELPADFARVLENLGFH